MFASGSASFHLSQLSQILRPPLLYVLAILISRWVHGVSNAIYVLVALIWLVPDKRVERALATKG